VLAGALELFLVALGLIYFVGTTASGLRVIRADRRATNQLQRHRAGPSPAARRPPSGFLSGQRASLHRWLRFLWQKAVTADQPVPRASVTVDPADCVVYFIVPCLNEERVIEDSVRNLLADPRGIVMVVDDASDDRTARIASAIDPDRVVVLQRRLPEARLGKGPALNAGFAMILQDAAVRGIAPSRITVCVMDADGRLSDGALDAVLPLFADERVGGVQLPVRIRRVKGSVLTLLQDLEFWGVCAVAQLGRISSGTVSLGGNGQFTRLAALLELGDSPWRARLTEDLDLALALATAGWRLTSTPQAFVSQQGLTRLPALINQRTRWYQGHMQAGRWLSRLWLSRRLSHLSMLELTLYLLVPWALVLPWSVIFNYNLVLMAMWVAGWVTEPGLGQDLTERIVTVVIWYTVSCVPIWMAGYLYSRQRRKAGPFRALLLGHLLLLGNYITYIACWRGFFRLVVGANSWQKTKRHRERSHRAGRPVPVAFATLDPDAAPLVAIRPLGTAGPGATRPGTVVPVAASAALSLDGQPAAMMRSGPAVPAQRAALPAEIVSSARPDWMYPEPELVGLCIPPDRAPGLESAAGPGRTDDREAGPRGGRRLPANGRRSPGSHRATRPRTPSGRR
jgi:1,2-diacylglycerol 3-beta-glucosyltransferase